MDNQSNKTNSEKRNSLFFLHHGFKNSIEVPCTDQRCVRHEYGDNYVEHGIG